MGLVHPADLGAWQRDQDRRHPLRALRGRLRSDPAGVLTSGPDPRVLLVLDSTSPTSLAAILSVSAHLPVAEVAVLAPGDATGLLPENDHNIGSGADLPTSIEVVVSAGHHLALGAAAYDVARRRGLPYVVVQHGLLTPIAPPLPEDARLLAWSEQDAAFWTAERDDVRTEVVGSQLLWEAGAAGFPRSHGKPAAGGPPTYLGQLHGAELPRRDLADAAEAFCLATGATYRPHPSERDRRSLAQHRAWEAKGIRIDRSGTPLREVGTPVVSVFSTGVLEAAVRGVPAWVDFDDPPAWLADFWVRYDLRPWGGPPTPAPPRDTVSPAVRTAEVIAAMIGGSR